MTKRAMKKGRPKYAGQAAEVAWNDAVLVPMPVPEHVIPQENDPAKAGDRDYWGKAFKHSAELISHCTPF